MFLLRQCFLNEIKTVVFASFWGGGRLVYTFCSGCFSGALLFELWLLHLTTLKYTCIQLQLSQFGSGRVWPGRPEPGLGSDAGREGWKLETTTNLLSVIFLLVEKAAKQQGIYSVCWTLVWNWCTNWIWLIQKRLHCLLVVLCVCPAWIRNVESLIVLTESVWGVLVLFTGSGWMFYFVIFIQTAINTGVGIGAILLAGECLKVWYHYYLISTWASKSINGKSLHYLDCLFLFGKIMYSELSPNGSLKLYHFIAMVTAVMIVISQLPTFHSLRHINFGSLLLSLGYSFLVVGACIYAGTESFNIPSASSFIYVPLMHRIAVYLACNFPLLYLTLVSYSCIIKTERK